MDRKFLKEGNKKVFQSMLLDPNKQDNAKQNNFNILAYPRQAKQNNQQQMQLGVQEKGTSNSLLV